MSENSSHFLKRSRSTRSHPESSAATTSSSKTAALLGVSSRQRRSTTTNTSSARKNQTRNRDENSTEFVETDGLVSLPASRPASPTEQLATNLSSLSVDDLRRALSDLTEPRLLKCARAVPASNNDGPAVIDDKNNNANVELQSRPTKHTSVTLANTLQCVPIVEQNETGSNNGTPPHSAASPVEQVASTEESARISPDIDSIVAQRTKTEEAADNEKVNDESAVSRDSKPEADAGKNTAVVGDQDTVIVPANTYKRKSASEKLRTRSANYDCDDAASEGSKTPRAGVSPTTNITEAKEILHRMVSYQHEKIKREEKVFDVEYAAKSKSLPRDNGQRHRPHSSSLPSCNVPLPPPMHSISWNKATDFVVNSAAEKPFLDDSTDIEMKLIPRKSAANAVSQVSAPDASDAAEPKQEQEALPRPSGTAICSTIKLASLSPPPATNNYSSSSSAPSERSGSNNSENNNSGKFSVTMTGANRCGSSAAVTKQDPRFKLEAFPDKTGRKTRSSTNMASSVDAARCSAKALQQFKSSQSASSAEMRRADLTARDADNDDEHMVAKSLQKFLGGVTATAVKNAEQAAGQPILGEYGIEFSSFDDTMRSLEGVPSRASSSTASSPHSYKYKQFHDDQSTDELNPDEDELEVPQVLDQRRRLTEREIVPDSFDEEDDDDQGRADYRRNPVRPSKLGTVRGLTSLASGKKVACSASAAGQLNDNNSTSSESSKATNSSAEASSKYNGGVNPSNSATSPARRTQQVGGSSDADEAANVHNAGSLQLPSSNNNHSSRSFDRMDDYITPSRTQRHDSVDRGAGDHVNNIMPSIIYVRNTTDSDNVDAPLSVSRLEDELTKSYTSFYPPPRGLAADIDDSNVVQNDVRERYNHLPTTSAGGKSTGGTFIRFSNRQIALSKQQQAESSIDNISPQRMQAMSSSQQSSSSMRRVNSSDDGGSNGGTGSGFHHRHSPTGLSSYHAHYHTPTAWSMSSKGMSVEQAVQSSEREKQQRQEETDQIRTEIKIKKRKELREKMKREQKTGKDIVADGAVWRGGMDVGAIEEYINNGGSAPAATTSSAGGGGKGASPLENKQRQKQSRRVSSDSNPSAVSSVHESTPTASEPRVNSQHDLTASKSSPGSQAIKAVNSKHSPPSMKPNAAADTPLMKDAGNARRASSPVASSLEMKSYQAANASSLPTSESTVSGGNVGSEPKPKQRRTKKKNRKAFAKSATESGTTSVVDKQRNDDGDFESSLSPSRTQDDDVNDIVNFVRANSPPVIVLWINPPEDLRRDSTLRYGSSENNEQRQQNMHHHVSDAGTSSTIKRQPSTKNCRSLSGSKPVSHASTPADGSSAASTVQNSPAKCTGTVALNDEKRAERSENSPVPATISATLNDEEDDGTIKNNTVADDAITHGPAGNSVEANQSNVNMVSPSPDVVDIPVGRGKAAVGKTYSTGSKPKTYDADHIAGRGEDRRKPAFDADRSKSFEQQNDKPITSETSTTGKSRGKSRKVGSENRQNSTNHLQEARKRGSSVSDVSAVTPAVAGAAMVNSGNRNVSGCKQTSSSSRFGRSTSDKCHFSTAASTLSNSSPPGPGPATPAVSGSSGDGYVTAQTDSRSESVFESTSVEPDTVNDASDAGRNQKIIRGRSEVNSTASSDTKRSQRKLTRQSAGASGSSSNNDVVFDDAATTTRNTTSVSLRDDNESLTTGADEFFDDRASTAASEPLHAVSDNGWTKVEGAGRRRRSHNHFQASATGQNTHLPYHPPFLRTHHQYYHHRNSGSSVGAQSSSGPATTSGSNVYSASDDGRDGMPSSLHQRQSLSSSYRTVSGRVKSRSLERRHGDHLNNTNRDAIIEDHDDDERDDSESVDLSGDSGTARGTMNNESRSSQTFYSSKFKNQQRFRGSGNQQWRSNNESSNIYDRDGYTDEDYADINARKQQQMGPMMPKSAEHEDINQNTAKQRLIAHDPSKAPPRSSATLADSGKNTRVGSGGILMNARSKNDGGGRRSDPQPTECRVNMILMENLVADDNNNRRSDPTHSKKQQSLPVLPNPKLEGEMGASDSSLHQQQPKRNTPPLPADVADTRAENVRKYSLDNVSSVSFEASSAALKPGGDTALSPADNNDAVENDGTQNGTLKRAVQSAAMSSTTQPPQHQKQQKRPVQQPAQHVGSREYPEYNHQQPNAASRANDNSGPGQRSNNNVNSHGASRAASGQYQNGKSRFSPVPSSNHGNDSGAQTITFQQYRNSNYKTSNASNTSSARRSLPPGGGSDRNISVSALPYGIGGRYGGSSYSGGQQQRGVRDFSDRKQSGSSGGGGSVSGKTGHGGSNNNNKPSLVKSKSKEFPPLGAPPSLARGGGGDAVAGPLPASGVPVVAVRSEFQATAVPATTVATAAEKPVSAATTPAKLPPKSAWKSMDDSSLLSKRIAGVNNAAVNASGGGTVQIHHGGRKSTNDDMLYAAPSVKASPSSVEQQPLSPRLVVGDALQASGDAGVSVICGVHQVELSTLPVASIHPPQSAFDSAQIPKNPIIMPPRKSSMQDEISEKAKQTGRIQSQPIAVRPLQTRRSATTDNMANSPGSMDFPPLPVPEGIRAKIRQQKRQEQPQIGPTNGIVAENHINSEHSAVSTVIPPVAPSIETVEITHPPPTPMTSDVGTQMTPTNCDYLLQESQEAVRGEVASAGSTGLDTRNMLLATDMTKDQPVTADKSPSNAGNSSTTFSDRQQQFQHLISSRAVPPVTPYNLPPASVQSCGNTVARSVAVQPKPLDETKADVDVNAADRHRADYMPKEALSLRASPTLPHHVPLPGQSSSSMRNSACGTLRVTSADDSAISTGTPATEQRRQLQYSQPSASQVHRSNSNENALSPKTVPVMSKPDKWSHVRRQQPASAASSTQPQHQQQRVVPAPQPDLPRIQNKQPPSPPMITDVARAAPDSENKIAHVVAGAEQHREQPVSISSRSQSVEHLPSIASSSVRDHLPIASESFTSSDPEPAQQKSVTKIAAADVVHATALASELASNAPGSASEADNLHYAAAASGFKPLTRQLSQPNLAAAGNSAAATQSYTNHSHLAGRQHSAGFSHRPFVNFQQQPPPHAYPLLRQPHVVLPAQMGGLPLIRVRTGYNSNMPTQFLPAPPPSASWEGPLPPPPVGFPPIQVAGLMPVPTVVSQPRFYQQDQSGSNVKIHSFSGNPSATQHHASWQLPYTAVDPSTGHVVAAQNQVRPLLGYPQQQQQSPQILNQQIQQFSQQQSMPFTVQNFIAIRGPPSLVAPRPTMLIGNSVPLMRNIPLQQHQQQRFVLPLQQPQQPVYIDLAPRLPQYHLNGVQMLPPHLPATAMMVDPRTGHVIPVASGGVGGAHFSLPNAYDNAPPRELHEGHIYKRPPYPPCVFDAESAPQQQSNTYHRRSSQYQPTGLSYNMQTERLYGDMHNVNRSMLSPQNGFGRNLQQQSLRSQPQSARKFQQRSSFNNNANNKNTNDLSAENNRNDDITSVEDGGKQPPKQQQLPNGVGNRAANNEQYKQAVNSYRKIVKHFEDQYEEQQKQQQATKKTIAVLSRSDKATKILRPNEQPPYNKMTIPEAGNENSNPKSAKVSSDAVPLSN